MRGGPASVETTPAARGDGGFAVLGHPDRAAPWPVSAIATSRGLGRRLGLAVEGWRRVAAHVHGHLAIERARAQAWREGLRPTAAALATSLLAAR